MLEYARTLFISLTTNPIVAANTAVNAPTPAITNIVVSDSLMNGNNLTSKNTPAATIVAECTNALTGVGPSIASGNQVWKGNCADLPIAPDNIPRVTIVTIRADIVPPKAHKSGICSTLTFEDSGIANE